MSLFYFDTSAILKRYKTEKGSDVIDELFDKKAPGEIFARSFLTALVSVKGDILLFSGCAASVPGPPTSVR